MFDMTKDISEESVKLLKQKTANFINKHFLPPSKKIMQKWLKKKLPQNYWSKIKHITEKFRRSLPIVSHQTPDNKQSTKGKKNLGQTFAAPSWVSADLGKNSDLKYNFYLLQCRFFSLTWQKIWELFYCCTNFIGSSFHQEN